MDRQVADIVFKNKQKYYSRRKKVYLHYLRRISIRESALLQKAQPAAGKSRQERSRQLSSVPVQEPKMKSFLALLSVISSTVAFSAKAPGTNPSVIVGGGRIGSLLKDLGTDEDVVVKRGEPIVPDNFPDGPIYVCTRNDDLEAIVKATPESRRGDLCFLQNGMLGELSFS